MPVQQPRALWQAVLGELQLEVARASYETFLKDTAGTACQDSRLTVVTPSPFVAEYLQQKLYPLVKRTVEKVAREPLEVRFHVAADEPPSKPEATHVNGTASRASAPASTLPLNTRCTFETFIVGKSNQFAHAAAVAAADYPGQKYNPVFIYSGVGLG
ncbi:MAG: chromosomal replication initiator protein DnaA, partial [SAR202 cluster bacterium]|nr:chromosomal replication initiator protein DnaA [SAR202 cluster bacterium]